MMILKFVVLFLLYFIQALPYGFQSRYLPLIMRKQGVSITSLGIFKLLLIPWILKFFIATFIIDMYKTKRFWILLTLFSLSFISFLSSFLANFVTFDFNDITFFYIIAFILFGLNLFSSSNDICVDWLTMKILTQEELGMGNTIQVSGFKLGTLFSGGLLVYFIDQITLDVGFFLFGLIYLISFGLLKYYFNSIFNNDENVHGKRSNDNEDIEKKIENNLSKLSFKNRICLLIQSPSTIWICAFVLIYKLGEQSSLNIIPIYLLDNKIESSKIGLWTGMYGQSASILGSFIGGVLLKKLNKKMSTLNWLNYTLILRLIPIILITIIVCSFETNKLNNADKNNPIQFESYLNHESNEPLLLNLYILIVLQLFLSGLLTTFTFTHMMEISYQAPEHIQATHFSLLSTCEVFGKLLFQPFISFYTDSHGYTYAFILFTLLYILSYLIFLLRNFHSNFARVSSSIQKIKNKIL